MKLQITILLFFIFKLKLSNGDILEENFLFQIKNKVLPVLQSYAPIFYTRITTLLSNGAYDSIAPYHATAKPLYSTTIPKRPENERTIRNKNIAIAYASLRILNNLLPSARYIWETELRNAGLDPDDISTDLTSPIGIGNTVSENVLNFRINDGMNQEGNTVYHKARYSDTVSYKPKNSPYEITSPDHWQPNIEKSDYGVFSSQVHVVTQYGTVKPYSLTNLDSFITPLPVKSQISNKEGYVEQVQQVLRESYTLDDRKKMVSEYFDDKSWSLDGSLESVIKKNKLDLDEYVFLQLAVKIAIFDGGIVTWKEKLDYDTVRPFTAIRFLYENTPLKAWGGPGVGPVDDIKGREWRSYTRTPPHSEYPSGSTCFCSAQAQVLRRYFNTSFINFSIEFPQGSSKIEPCKTPSSDLKIDFSTYDEFVHVCGLSRVYSGVHFMSAVIEAEKLCKPVGDIAYDFVQTLVNGDGKDGQQDWGFNESLDFFNFL
jgi:hypothetical protein